MLQIRFTFTNLASVIKTHLKPRYVYCISFQVREKKHTSVQKLVKTTEVHVEWLEMWIMVDYRKLLFRKIQFTISHAYPA